MAYITQAEILGDIDADSLREALDDDRDNVADEGVWDLVQASAAGAVDALLEGRYAVPFDPPPAKVKEATKVFALEKLFQKRGKFGDANPWTAAADRWRADLRAIAEGDSPLQTGKAQAKAPGILIYERSRLNRDGGCE